MLGGERVLSWLNVVGSQLVLNQPASSVVASVKSPPSYGLQRLTPSGEDPVGVIGGGEIATVFLLWCGSSMIGAE